MRRPLKPFVTEYKGAARRQSNPASQPLKMDTEPAVPRQAEPRPFDGSRSVPPPQEDGYEAALRAADALFAPSPRADARQPDDAPPRAAPAPRSADAWSADPWSGDSRAADPRPADPWSDTQPPAEAPTPPTPSVAPAPNGGRILRVIDEPPSPELLRLEAERAPKRRGRKPGSKNKPKPAVVVETAIPAAATPAEAAEPIAAFIDDAAPEPVPALAAKVYRLPARPASEPARDEKYAWVRTKLKPGERWKRRLPKVAW